MKVTTSVLALLPAALAAPRLFSPGNALDLAGDVIEKAQSWLSDEKDQWIAANDDVAAALRINTVNMHGMEYMTVEHPAFPLHRLRVVEPDVCDPAVKQLSGYLDISETKHLFFWFQESRNKPKEDPLVLWLNGGPGCSSTTGLMFELGGCAIADEGRNLTYNKYAWNSVANVIYLDQPIGVGFSYADGSEEVSDSHAAAEDVYAFLSLFISQFRKYSKQDFHVAGESYAGQYIPNIADVIYKKTAALAAAPNPNLPTLNFKSVLIGDGVTDPKAQYASVPDWACDGPYAVFDPRGSECANLRTKAARCERLAEACYKSNTRFTCVPAELYCVTQMIGPIQQLGLNLYDVRRPCNHSEEADGPLCYRETRWVETYLNQPAVKENLGVPAEINFESCNNQINQKFLLQGDGVHYAGALLGPLIDSGIRVLIYAGQADAIVNYIGCSRVVDNLQMRYAADYAAAKVHNFTDINGDVVGWTKQAGKGAGNITFVAFENAGHMVPHDDPMGALAMVSRWFNNEPLA
ncbi:Alpha/Beta hydrolase protein [Kockovaella imperatae]|uniref:Carboxypeptidase n=1 Tax=Kockovaella imperatae TaxID=4999 RepID=A0A1Y1ULK9_9TREE|nr:Alpha/Beta hydrolase protein [Kockovaella imperatae]ORX38931.1 Alpha/Beta hydrolase protein [Kockovaella imperatae]